MQQRRGQVETPLHAAAVVLDAILSAIGQADKFERLADRTRGGHTVQIVERREELKVGLRRQLVEQREILRHQPDAPLVGIGVAA